MAALENLTNQLECRKQSAMDFFESFANKFNGFGGEMWVDMPQNEVAASLAAFSVLVVAVINSTITFEKLKRVLPYFEEVFSTKLIEEFDENGEPNMARHDALRQQKFELLPYHMRLAGALYDVSALPDEQQTVAAVRGALLRSVSLHNLYSIDKPDRQLDVAATFEIDFKPK